MASCLNCFEILWKKTLYETKLFVKAILVNIDVIQPTPTGYPLIILQI